MSVSNSSAAVVALLRNAHRSWRECCAALESGEDPAALLEREHGLLAAQLLDAARREISHWQVRHIRPITFLDPDYPANLRAAGDRPPLIFLAGALAQTDQRAVAVIGSRSASQRGLSTAREVAEALVANGYTVVSGLAAGIDTAAHTGALERGGRTIAVIGTGLMRCYPPENRDLQEQIAREGAVVSRFWPEDPPTRPSFPLRNAVMAGISLANVIVEATDTSGVRIQARLALAQGRPVLLMASMLEHPWARELATQSGVHVIASPHEVPRVVGGLMVGSLAA